jgi:hypothetical protein
MRSRSNPHLVATLCIVLVALATFIAGRSTAPGRVTVRQAEAAQIVRLHDAEQAVTCWRVVGGDGLSCLPDQWLASARIDAEPEPMHWLVGRWEPAE